MNRPLVRMALWYAVVAAIAGIWAFSAGYFRPERLSAAMMHLGVPALLALTGVNGAILLSAAGRWWRILTACGHRIKLGRLTAYRVAAGAVSYVTPGTQFGGEPLQAFLLVDREGVPADLAAASVVLERGLELALNAAVVAGALVWFAPQLLSEAAGGPEPLLSGRFPWGWVAVAAGAGAALWILSRFRPRKAFRTLGRLIRETWGRMAWVLQNDPKAIAAASAIGLVHWGLVFMEFGILYACVGERLTAGQVMVVLVAARLGLWVPVPGGVGALEAGQLVAAGMLGLPVEAAAGVCLLIRLRDVAVCSAGLFLSGRYIGQSVKGNGHERMEKKV